ncbi:MAG: hypothetical protein ACI8RP_001789 [Urechidicola sp.]|jgi:hypothetical protein
MITREGQLILDLKENYDAETAAIFTLKCLRFQKKNIETLESSIAISYEELASNPSRFVDKISTILPELNDINTSKEFSAHNPVMLGNLETKCFCREDS